LKGKNRTEINRFEPVFGLVRLKKFNLIVYFDSKPDLEIFSTWKEEKLPRAPRCISITIVAVLRVRSLAGRSHGILWLYKKPEKGHASERNEKTGGMKNRKTEKQRRHTQRTRRQKERTGE
jgi:hypothetical protein